MKTLSLIFTFLMLINSVSYAFADHCLDDSECMTASDDCDVSNVEHDSSEKHSETHNEECNIHCFHPPGIFTSQKNIDLTLKSSRVLLVYSFHIKPVFLDSPLRPPLA